MGNDYNCNCAICRNYKAFEMPKGILEAAKNGKLVLFCGAGISTESKNVLPESFYTTIQDGVLHSFDRFVQLYNTGNYNIPGSVSASIRYYDELVQSKKKIGNYWDSAYYEGYENGLMYIVACGKSMDIIDEFPDYYLPNTKVVLDSYDSFEKELRSISKRKGKYHKYAIRILDNLIGTKGIVLHHPPY